MPYDILQLNDMLIPELVDVADTLSIPNAKSLDKKELVDKILDRQANNGKAAEEEPKKKRGRKPKEEAVAPAKVVAAAPAPPVEAPAPTPAPAVATAPQAPAAPVAVIPAPAEDGDKKRRARKPKEDLEPQKMPVRDNIRDPREPREIREYKQRETPNPTPVAPQRTEPGNTADSTPAENKTVPAAAPVKQCHQQKPTKYSRRSNQQSPKNHSIHRTSRSTAARRVKKNKATLTWNLKVLLPAKVYWK